MKVLNNLSAYRLVVLGFTSKNLNLLNSWMGCSTVVFSGYTFRGHIRELENKRMVSVEDDTKPSLLVAVQNKQSNKPKKNDASHDSTQYVVEESGS